MLTTTHQRLLKTNVTLMLMIKLYIIYRHACTFHTYVCMMVRMHEWELMTYLHLLTAGVINWRLRFQLTADSSCHPIIEIMETVET